VLKYYLVLGVSFPSTDEEIRRAYLDMVKRFPPERNPQEFAAISEAYEALKDEAHRIRTSLLSFLHANYPEDDILALGRMSRLHAGQAGLRDLMEAERVSD
jgi:DnaJ-class molecular chaperone